MTAFEPLAEEMRATREEVRPHRLFLLIAPFLYAAYALLTPPFQSFDENQHLDRAWQISSLQFTGERRGAQSGGNLPPGLGEATVREIGSVVPLAEPKVVRRPISEMFGRNTPIGSDRKPIFYDFFGSVVYSPVGYLPQVFAVQIGKSADLSVEWTLRLGRLLNLALCIGLVVWALKLVPFGRWLMLIVALSPPMAAGAAAFGQDALVNGGGFLLTALGLRIAAEKRWTGSRAAIVGLVGIAVSLAKFAYLPLVAIAALPLPRGVRMQRWLLPPMLIGSAAAALIYAWMRLNAHAVVDPFLPWMPTFAEQLSWAISNPLDFSLLIARTWLFWLPSAWARLYTFGDATVPGVRLAAVPGIAGLLAMMAYGDRDATALTRGRRIWMLLIFAAVALLITIAMFMTLAGRGAATIDGIQGRYFLPVFPLGAFALMRRGETAPPVIRTVALILVLVANVAALGTILTIFYSF
jgi:uncharacterized membrane protein